MKSLKPIKDLVVEGVEQVVAVEDTELVEEAVGELRVVESPGPEAGDLQQRMGKLVGRGAQEVEVGVLEPQEVEEVLAEGVAEEEEEVQEADLGPDLWGGT